MRIFVPSAAALLTDHAPHGEGLIAWNLLSGLAERGHELVVCARTVSIEAAAPFELVETGRASRLESLEPLAYARRAQRLFRELGGRNRFDLVHWLFPSQPDDVSFVPADGTPYVVGPVFEAWPRAARARRRRTGDVVRAAARPLFASRWLRVLTSARVLIAATEGAAGSIPPRHRSKVRLLPPGVDAARFAPSPLPAVRRVLFVGSLEVEKGVGELVDAFAAVRARLPDAELVLAGAGSQEAAIRRRAAALGLNGALLVSGPVRHRGIPAVLRDASLLCLPSLREPYGMVVVEAMAAGRAVVATGAGGPGELVDPVRGGRLVRAGDVAGLASALVDVLDDRDRLREMGEFNRRRVESGLTIDASLDRLEAIYAEALA